MTQQYYTIEEARAISKQHIRALADTIPARLKAIKSHKEKEHV